MNPILPLLPDARLLARLRARDRAAFEAVVRSRYESVYRQLWHLTRGDADTAADLTQETFIAAWASLPGFNGRCAVGTYLHTIAVRVWYRHTQRNRNRATETPLAASLAALLCDDAAPDPARTAETAAARTALARAVSDLPAPYRRAVTLFYAEERKYREIADDEAVAIGTVKSRLHAALKLLRERLAPRKEEIL